MCLSSFTISREITKYFPGFFTRLQKLLRIQCRPCSRICLESLLPSYPHYQTMKLFSGRPKPATDTSVMKIVDTHIDDSSSSNYREWLLAISNSKLYIAMQMGTICTSLNRTDPSTWTDDERPLAPVRIDPANLYPEYKPSYHRFRWRKGEDHAAVFKKYRDPLKLAAELGSLDDFRHDIIARVTEREIHTCELLRDNPCKNIAKYRGVQCKDVLKLGHAGASMRLDTERVIKLVFKRYDCDLHELVKNRQYIDVKYCLQSIALKLILPDPRRTRTSLYWGILTAPQSLGLNPSLRVVRSIGRGKSSMILWKKRTIGTPFVCLRHGYYVQHGET
jgi:hypothetical protein